MQHYVHSICILDDARKEAHSILPYPLRRYVILWGTSSEPSNCFGNHIFIPQILAVNHDHIMIRRCLKGEGGKRSNEPCISDQYRRSYQIVLHSRSNLLNFHSNPFQDFEWYSYLLKSIIIWCQVISHNLDCNSDPALVVPPDDYNGPFVL
jgi:hypothetical protein